MNKKQLALLTLCSVSLFGSEHYTIDYDPFARTHSILQKVSHRVKRRVSLTPTAIYNAKAYINGRFYSVKEKIMGYTIVAITPHGVSLKKGKKYRFVALQKQHHNHYFHIKDKH